MPPWLKVISIFYLSHPLIQGPSISWAFEPVPRPASIAFCYPGTQRGGCLCLTSPLCCACDSIAEEENGFYWKPSFPFYWAAFPTACVPARADAIYIFFSDEKMKVCKLSLLLAVGGYLSLRCIRGLEMFWRTRALQDPGKVVFSSLLPATH